MNSPIHYQTHTKRCLIAKKRVWCRTMKWSISALVGRQCTMYSWTESNLWTSLNPLELNRENHFSSLFSPHTFRCSLHQECKLLKAQILSLWRLYFVFDFDILILAGLFYSHEAWMDTAGCYCVPYRRTDELWKFRWRFNDVPGKTG